MNRLLLGVALVGVAAVLGGCPIYPDQTGENVVCDSNACYSCPGSTYTSACTPLACQTDYDCPSPYQCNGAGACVASGTPVGDDASTDCSLVGCPAGEVCKLSNGVLACVPAPGGDDATSPVEGGGDASSEASSPGDGGTTPDATSEGGDAADGSDGGATTVPCNSDATCGGSGAKCVDGACVQQLQLCSDGSQCKAKGSACVDGICEPRCSSTLPCPTGYQCDLTRLVCNVDPAPCTGSGTSTCQGGTTCVDGHCVPPCATGDAACPNRQTCVNGGCIPDQGATFACANDGEAGQLATTCPSGAICLHHDCYPACATDGGIVGAGEGGTGCSNGDVCKNVTIETGSYLVCGTATTLGSDCDPAQGNYCSGGKVCVDGYCL